MIVHIETRAPEELEDFDYRDFLKISFDGKQVFRVEDGEPEDANLSRDFSDCYNIKDMLKAAHAAGLRGEKLEFETAEE